METGMLHLHNLLRWVILILLFLSIAKAYSGWKQGKVFSPGDRKIWLFTLIASHVMLVIGIYQLLAGRIGILTSTLPEGVSVMSDKFFRFFWVEHPLLMIISIIMITLAYGRAKKPIPDASKYKQAFWLFFIALLLILISIPWPFREIIGENRGWFPGM